MADLLASRDDPATFSAQARGVALIDWQAHELREAATPGRLTCWCWGRQMGKSERLADLALWAAFTRPGALVLLVSGGGELGARRLLATARRLAASSRLLAGSVADEGASVLRLSNGSELRCVSASEHSVRGWSADALLVDECQLVPDDLLLSAALPTVAARPHAFIVLAGTAGRAEGAFYDLSRRAEVGDAEGARFSRRVSRLVGGDDPAPWLSPSSLAQLEAAMGPARADAELRCIWSAGGAFLFGRGELDAVTADYLAPGLAGLEGPASVAAGLDLATTRDRAALVAVGRIPADADHPVFAVRTAHRWPERAPLFAEDGGVLAEVATLPVPLDWLCVDSTGMQGGFVQALTPLIRRRPRALGGGEPPPKFVVIEEMWDGSSRTMAHVGGQLVPYRARRESRSVRATDLRGVPFSAPMKAATTGALQGLIQRRALVLPASATDLRRELLGVRVGLTGGGAETFEAQSGGYDDLFDALLLALGPYRDRAGRWRAQVGDLAERQSTPGRWSGGDALTGCGLRLPARPRWQGVRGEDHVPPEAEAERSELVAAVLGRLTNDDNGGSDE